MSLWKYILRRMLIMVPTLFGITLVVFVIINAAPGGPIERKIQQMRFGSGDGGDSGSKSAINQEVIEALKKQYGFDKPMMERYFIWLKNLSKLDFGKSFSYEGEKVTDVIISKIPVSLQFGIISLILSYLVCIPLGVFKAMKEGTQFDTVSSLLLFILYSIPSYMLAVVLLTYLSGETFLDIFPLGELYSDDYEFLSPWEKIKDRIHHFVLPLVCYMIGSFTTLTMLMRNSLLDEIKKDYVRTARAKGLSKKVVYLKHALRNALIPIVTGLGHFLSLFFAGSLLLETIFQLDGMGFLGFNAALERDYNVLMGLIFIQSFLYLLGNLISDIMYVIVDPRIDFS